MARQRKPSRKKQTTHRQSAEPTSNKPHPTHEETGARPTDTFWASYLRDRDPVLLDPAFARYIREIGGADPKAISAFNQELARLTAHNWSSQQPSLATAARQRLTKKSPPPDTASAIPEIGKLRAHGPKNWEKSRDAKRIARAIKRQESTPLIVMATDIRASNTLMKEAVDLYRYASILEAFTKHARDTVWDSKGLFDKFTGDGFLAYWPFSQSLENTVLRRVFVVVQKVFQAFSEDFIPEFRANSQNFPGGIGLAVGLDEGAASIVAIADEPTIVGPAVVGATRMVDVAYPWETLANVRLGEHLAKEISSGQFSDVEVKPQIRTTKEYEEQTAYRVSLATTASPLS